MGGLVSWWGNVKRGRWMSEWIGYLESKFLGE